MKDEFMEEFIEWKRDIFGTPGSMRCSFCDTVMEQHHGYSENDEYYWICPKCNNSFTIRDIFDGFAEEYEDFYEE